MAKLSIKITIGNREYPMKVEEQEEEMIRKAGKTLNERIKEHQAQFGNNRDMQDLIAIVAFDCLVEKLREKESTDISADFALKEVSRLNHLISESI